MITAIVMCRKLRLLMMMMMMMMMTTTTTTTMMAAPALLKAQVSRMLLSLHVSHLP